MSMTIGKFAAVLGQATISEKGRAVLSRFVKEGKSFVIVADSEIRRNLRDILETAVATAVVPENDWRALFGGKLSPLLAELAGEMEGTSFQPMMIVYGD